jgi:hypothetical protein
MRIGRFIKLLFILFSARKKAEEFCPDISNWCVVKNCWLLSHHRLYAIIVDLRKMMKMQELKEII